MGALKAVVARHPSLRWVQPAGGAVAFPRIHGLDDAEPFVQILLDRYGIGVVSGRFFGCPEHFRVAVGGDPETLEPALEALDGALADRCWENAAT
jgi:aspartate/methionine/tyrosine aminotransferase